jgi:hypothetical protein
MPLLCSGGMDSLDVQHFMYGGGSVHAIGEKEKSKKAPVFIAYAAAVVALACMHLARDKKERNCVHSLCVRRQQWR